MRETRWSFSASVFRALLFCASSVEFRFLYRVPFPYANSFFHPIKLPLLYDLHPSEESEIFSFRPLRRNCLHLKCNAVTLHAKMLLLPDTMAAAL